MATTQIKPKPDNLFRSIALRSEPKQVDRGSGVIRGVKVMELGPLKEGDPRPFFVDETTLAQVVELGNRPKQGVKSRFTHPNMSEDGLGKHLGKQKEFRIEGDAAVADFHRGTSADAIRADHIFDMATEAPEDIGLSIVAVFDDDAMESERTEEGLQPIRLTGLRAVDFVDTGAATDGLFSDDQTGIPATVTTFLETYFADSNPDDVAARAMGLLQRHYGCTFNPENYSMSMTQAPADPVVEADDFNRELGQRYVAAFGDIGAVWCIEGKTFEECFALKIAGLESQIGELAEENTDLQTRLDAALSLAGEEESLDSTEGVQLSDEEQLLASRINELVAEGQHPNRAKFIANAEAQQLQHGRN